ncbi:MAG TPA: hypothetical protein QGH10_13365 [Armatimonadota bacterium]|nr:hypothetical protein [Armatimonadota bacterium]
MSADSNTASLDGLPARVGEYYDADVPATLDLTERAKLGILHFTSILDAENGYQMRWTGNPTEMSHGKGIYAICQPKAFEAMAMLRAMSGSRQGLRREARMVETMVSLLGEDGLWWTPEDGEGMPWLGPQEMLPNISPHGAGRMLRAMIAWYQYTGDEAWAGRIDRMVEGFDRVLVARAEDYAYVPVPGGSTEVTDMCEYLDTCYVRDRGWAGFEEPMDEKTVPGTEGSLLCHTGHFPGALANWHRLTGSERALRLSGELARFHTKPRFWADWEGGEYPGVVGAEHAHWHGHVHGYLNTLRAVLEYAIAANDPKLKAFARDGYEWTRQPTLARFGFVGDCQGCGCGRLIGLAIKLSDAGVGDYWEDVDTYVRNIHAEMQFMPEDLPGLAADWEARAGSADATPEEAMVGGFAGPAFGEDFKNQWYLCCSPHGNMGLFYAWDGILRYAEGTARVNLLLNRASPWLDIDSYLPYEGKVVLRNKACAEAFIRIPLWVDGDTVECRIGDRSVRPAWFGRYLRLGDLKEGDVVTIEFPIEERTEEWTGPAGEGWTPTLGCWFPQPAADRPTTFTLRGNTIVGLSQPITPGNPLFQRRADKYRATEAPMARVERFVTPTVLRW